MLAPLPNNLFKTVKNDIEAEQHGGLKKFAMKFFN